MSDALEFDSLGPGDYDRAKRVLNAAKHPGFVGRELFYRCATNGQARVAHVGGRDLGVALIASNKLVALSVAKDAQGQGVGAALVAKCQPQWVSAIVDRVPWFEKRGYSVVGAPKVGANGKMATQLMQLTGQIGPEPTAVTVAQSWSAPIDEPRPIAPIGRALGLVKVKGMALKVLQQQIADCMDRRLDQEEREFIIEALKALVGVSKQRAETLKTDPKTPPGDPVKTLGE